MQVAEPVEMQMFVAVEMQVVEPVETTCMILNLMTLL